MPVNFWSRQTLANLTVNFVPLVILAVFTVVFLVQNPWGFTPPIIPAFMLLVLVTSFGLLLVLTYVMARLIEIPES